MREENPWVRALQISPSTYQEWKTLAPVEESFTFWCLSSGRLTTDLYLAWAQEHYELARLHSTYFDLTPSQSLWKQIHSVANWSPWMLPLEQWDGVVFIGCVEPPTDTTWSFPVRYVLADPADLERLWRAYHQVDSEEPADAPPPIPELQAPTSDGAPAGLELSIEPKKKFTLSLDTLGFNADASAAVAPEEPPPAEEVVNEAPLEPQALAVPSTEDADLSLETAAIPIARPKVAPAPAITSIGEGAAVDLRQAPEQLSQSRDEDQVIAWCFRQLKSQFQFSLVFVLGPEGLQPWRWDSHLKPQAVASTTVIPLEPPSFLRVAVRTGKPYHGYTVETPMNQKFFLMWGFKQIPNHVTAVPMIVDDHVRGLIIGISDKKTEGLNLLDFAERITERTVEQLQQVGAVFKSEAA